MNTIEFTLPSQIIRIDLTKPNIFFAPRVDLSDNLFQNICDVVSAKKFGLFNLTAIVKNQFKLISLASTENLESDLKLTSKSKTLELIKSTLSNIDEMFLSDQLDEINNSVMRLTNTLFSSLPFNEDYKIIPIEPISLIKNYTELYVEHHNAASSDYPLFSVLSSLIPAGSDTIVVVQDFPRTMDLYMADIIIERLSKTSAGLIIITGDVNYMAFADSSNQYNCHYYQDGIFHKSSPIDGLSKNPFVDKIFYYNRLAISAKSEQKYTDSFFEKYPFMQ